MKDSGRHITLPYKKLTGANQESAYLDVYFPSINLGNPSAGPVELPAVIYFHGGGLTVGNRESWLPTWLQGRTAGRGWLFISADYQLLPPATGHDIVQDIKDLFSFVVTEDLSFDGVIFKANPSAIAVAGSSAGGLCAYLAAIHCTDPRPKAVVSLYGMGGNFFSPHYLLPKTEVFFRGRELLEASEFRSFLYPFDTEGVLKPTSDSPLSYHPATYHIPGYPANPRMLLARLYLQLGVFLDYYTGEHNPSLSQQLRLVLASNNNGAQTFSERLPIKHMDLFPQLQITRSWPPTLLLHGTADSAVLISESLILRDALASQGVTVRMVEFPDMEHSFDYEPNADVLWKTQFDDVMTFLSHELEKDS